MLTKGTKHFPRDSKFFVPTNINSECCWYFWKQSWYVPYFLNFYPAWIVSPFFENSVLKKGKLFTFCTFEFASSLVFLILTKEIQYLWYLNVCAPQKPTTSAWTINSYIKRIKKPGSWPQMFSGESKTKNSLKNPVVNCCNLQDYFFQNLTAQTYLQLPLRQWGAGHVYLLAFSS